MKVLVLGSNSFLGKELKDYFPNFTFLSRKELDLENVIDVDKYFSFNYYDIVINTAVAGGKRNIVEDQNVLIKNLNIFNNLVRHKDSYLYLFNFCSGAAYDRKNNIDNYKEKEIFNNVPSDFYGLSKNIISREIYKYKNIYNFRIFGCFGIYEENTRFIKSSLNNLSNNKDIIIHKDKYIDYISTKDLCKIIEYYILNINKSLHKDINVVYDTKYKLSDIANYILHYKNSNKNVIIEEEGMDKSYTGNSDLLSSLNLNLKGLQNSLQELIKCQIWMIKNNKFLN